MKRARIYHATLVKRTDGHSYPLMVLDDVGRLLYFSSRRHDCKYWMLQLCDVFDVERLDDLNGREVLWDPTINYITPIHSLEKKWVALQVEEMD